LQSGTLKVVTYQSHDRFGLIGGLSYSDLTITETTVRSSGDTYLAYQISVKTTGETLAILLPRQSVNSIPTPTTAPTAAEFFTVESNGPTKSVIICDRLPNTNDLLPLTDTSSSLGDCSRLYAA
jgi:hypothetical protein